MDLQKNNTCRCWMRFSWRNNVILADSKSRVQYYHIICWITWRRIARIVTPAKLLFVWQALQPASNNNTFSNIITSHFYKMCWHKRPIMTLIMNTRNSEIQLIKFCWFDSPGLHVEVSLGKILNPKLLVMCWSAPCMAAATVRVWMNELLWVAFNKSIC